MNCFHSSKSCTKSSHPLVWKIGLIIIGSFLALILSFINLFRRPFILDVCVIGIIAFASLYVLLRLVYTILKRTRKKRHFATWTIILIIFVSSYMISTIVRFIGNPYDKRRWGNIFGKSYLTNYEQKKLGVVFPKNIQFLYYDEDIPWLEQTAKLIAIVDQKDLPEITRQFGETNKTIMDSNKFWYSYCKENHINKFYKYSNYVKGQSVTASILVIILDDNKAKLFMDIIYW